MDSNRCTSAPNDHNDNAHGWTCGPLCHVHGELLEVVRVMPRLRQVLRCVVLEVECERYAAIWVASCD
jgi:hypothetical protein